MLSIVGGHQEWSPVAQEHVFTLALSKVLISCVAGRGVLNIPKIPLGVPPKLQPLCSTPHLHDGANDNNQHLEASKD